MMRIGLVGLGGMGTVHYNNYLHMDEARVVAAVGKTDEDAKRAAEWGVPLYQAIADMVNKERIDMVDICTPTFLHREQVLESLSCGKHTITEKPIALCLSHAKEMYNLAEKQGVQLYVAQVLQFSREVEVLRQVVESREYGTALDGQFERLTACPKWSQGGWLLDKQKSGLVPFDLHIHDLDVIISLFGEPKDVRHTSCSGENKAYREQYRFTYAFDGGLHVSAEAAWFNAGIPFTARWRVYFENGLLVYDGEQVIGYPAVGKPKVYDTEEKVKIPTGINVPPTGWFLNELKHFVVCAKDNVPSPLVPKAQVLSVLRVLEQIAE